MYHACVLVIDRYWTSVAQQYCCTKMYERNICSSAIVLTVKLRVGVKARLYSRHRLSYWHGIMRFIGRARDSAAVAVRETHVPWHSHLRYCLYIQLENIPVIRIPQSILETISYKSIITKRNPKRNSLGNLTRLSCVNMMFRDLQLCMQRIINNCFSNSLQL